MQSLKLIISLCAAIFITTGVLAHSEDAQIIDAPLDTIQNESSKVSAAQAVSLFNFISLKEEKKDTSKTHQDDFSSSIVKLHVIEFFQAILI